MCHPIREVKCLKLTSESRSQNICNIFWAVTFQMYASRKVKGHLTLYSFIFFYWTLTSHICDACGHVMFLLFYYGLVANRFALSLTQENLVRLARYCLLYK